MSTEESHKIDDLFREELSDYKVPVALSTLPLLGLAMKKGLFYKLSLLKLNTLWIIAGTATVTSIATVVTVKVVEQYPKKNEVVHQSKQTVKVNKTETTFPVVKELKTQKSIEASVAKATSISNVQTIAPQSNNIEEKHNVSTNELTKTQQSANQTAIQTSKPVNQSITTSTTQPINTTPMVETKTENTKMATVSDSVRPAVRKVVYVKQKPVIIQDSVVKVIKKVRPKTE